MFGVPRVWEKIYAGVTAALGRRPREGPEVRRGRRGGACPIAEALDVGRRHRRGEGHLRVPRRGRLRRRARAARPRQVEVAITGAAPIPPELLRWFRAIGVPLSEIYGMSENTGPDDAGTPYRVKPGTVGPAVPGLRGRAGRGRRDHLPRRQRLPGLPQRPRRRRPRRSTPTAGSTPATSARSTTTATSASSTARRSSSSPPAARTSARPTSRRAQDDPARRPGLRHRRPAAVRRRARRARPRDGPGLGQAARASRALTLAELAEHPDGAARRDRAGPRPRSWRRSTTPSGSRR